MDNKKINFEDEIVMYSTKDIQRIFGISKNHAYQLMHTSGFPTIQINRKMFVSKEKLKKWIDSNSGRSITI